MTTPTPDPGRKLGWVPAPPDARTMKMAAYTTDALPTPPLFVDWLNKVPTWPMFRNDQVGDCEPAACAHLDQTWRANTGNGGQPLTDADVITAYSAVSGYDPATGVNDDGCRSLDMLNYWRKTGIGGHRVDAYVELDHFKHGQVRAAINLFGGLLIGALLPRDAAGQNRRHVMWRPTSGPNGGRGSWGGHALHVGAYNSKGLTAVTWGALQRMSWSWWDIYVVEAYAIVSHDFLSQTSGASPAGLRIDQLMADLHRVTG